MPSIQKKILKIKANYIEKLQEVIEEIDTPQVRDSIKNAIADYERISITRKNFYTRFATFRDEFEKQLKEQQNSSLRRMPIFMLMEHFIPDIKNLFLFATEFEQFYQKYHLAALRLCNEVEDSLYQEVMKSGKARQKTKKLEDTPIESDVEVQEALQEPEETEPDFKPDTNAFELFKEYCGKYKMHKRLMETEQMEFWKKKIYALKYQIEPIVLEGEEYTVEQAFERIFRERLV